MAQRTEAAKLAELKQQFKMQYRGVVLKPIVAGEEPSSIKQFFYSMVLRYRGSFYETCVSQPVGVEKHYGSPSVA